MPRSRPPYPAEFRAQMVELVRSGRSPEELSREFEPTAQAIRNWVAQADRDAGRRNDGFSLCDQLPHQESRGSKKAVAIYRY